MHFTDIAFEKVSKCVGIFVGIFKNKFAVFVCISMFWSVV